MANQRQLLGDTMIPISSVSFLFSLLFIIFIITVASICYLFSNCNTVKPGSNTCAESTVNK